MRYTINFTMYDGLVEEITVENAKCKNIYVSTIMRHKENIKSASYYPIYKNGSHGNVKVLI